MAHALAGLVAAAVLPAPRRKRLAFRLELPLDTWAAAWCLLALIVGGIAWAMGWLRWMEAATGTADQAAVAGQPDATLGGLMFLGPVQAIAYLFTPVGALLGYVAASGLLRTVVWASVREVPGDPIVTALLALWTALRRLQARRRAGALIGELPGDLVRETGEGALEIVCAQAREDLAVGASVEVDGRFYEIVSREAGREGKRTTVVHRLRELPPESVLRGLVRYRRRLE